MRVSLPPGVNQTLVPKRRDSTVGVPFGEARNIQIDQTKKPFEALSELAREQNVKFGRPAIYNTAVELRHSCDEFFHWCDDNPLLEKITNFSPKTCLYFTTDLPRKRPYTQSSLCLYLGIARETWHTWGKTEKFGVVVRQVNEIIREQKFAGAVAGFFNANIIARDLGLVDKQEVTGPNGGPIEKITMKMTPAEAAEMYAKTREDYQND